MKIFNLKSTSSPSPSFFPILKSIRRTANYNPKSTFPSPSIIHSPYGEPKSIIYSKGFTLVEMLIIAPIVILVIGVFVSAIVSMTGDVLAVRAANALTYNVQNALNTIDADVKASGGYLATNNITLTTGQGYDNATSVFKNADATNGTMLILNSYATTANPLSSTRNFVYLTNQPSACSSALISQNSKLMTNIVYFVKNNALWRRVIMPSTYNAGTGTNCATPWQKPTCAIGYDPATLTFCKANDIKMVDGISASGFIINYYAAGSTSANTTANASGQTDAARQAAMQTTNTIGVTINAAKTIAGRDITQSGVIKSVSANNNVSTPAVPITAYGTGSDGAITIAATKNLNTDTLATGRTCADAVNYSITTLTTNSATLSTTPPAGCLVAGDEMLLINLQGISSNYTNVGNYETLKILSISTNTITFTANKSKYYGNGVSDDTNIGTTTSNQRVMLQRVPNYTNVTINTGITLTASAWDGTKGGVLFFKASGAVANSGIINMSQNGYQGGVVGTLGFDWIGGKWTSKGNNGDAGGNAGMPGGGAGGAGGNSTIVNPATVVAATTTGSSTGGIAGGGGGGTGNYNSGGQGKCGGGGGAGGSWSSDVSVAGAGGGGCPYKMDTTDSYNITDTGITRISFGVGSATGGGSGGSGGASWPGTSTGGGGGLANGTGGTPGTGVNVPPAGANGTNGSSGGGIIMIYASTLTSGSQSIVSNGGNGGNGGGATTSWINPGNGGGAGSQGASGGTVIINSTSSVALSVALVKGGSGGSTDTGLSGGAGGAGATYVSGNDKGSVGGAGVNRNGYSASGGGGGGGSSGYAGKTVGLF